MINSLLGMVDQNPNSITFKVFIQYHTDDNFSIRSQMSSTYQKLEGINKKISSLTTTLIDSDFNASLNFKNECVNELTLIDGEVKVINEYLKKSGKYFFFNFFLTCARAIACSIEITPEQKEQFYFFKPTIDFSFYIPIVFKIHTLFNMVVHEFYYQQFIEFNYVKIFMQNYSDFLNEIEESKHLPNESIEKIIGKHRRDLVRLFILNVKNINKSNVSDFETYLRKLPKLVSSSQN